MMKGNLDNFEQCEKNIKKTKIQPEETRTIGAINTHQKSIQKPT